MSLKQFSEAAARLGATLQEDGMSGRDTFVRGIELISSASDPITDIIFDKKGQPETRNRLAKLEKAIGNYQRAALQHRGAVAAITALSRSLLSGRTKPSSGTGEGEEVSALRFVGFQLQDAAACFRALGDGGGGEPFYELAGQGARLADEAFLRADKYAFGM